MHIPELIDIVDSQILGEYLEQIENNDHCIIMTDADEEKAKLSAQLNDEQKKLLDRYTFALENKFDYIRYLLNTFVLQIGIKYGMDLQKAYNEE